MRWRLPTNKAGFPCRFPGRQGFTLIEIMVSVAILSIMAGLMVPMVYRVWESNEKSETRAKMAELKRAMVGDQRLVQNGIRMHYGFVGDNGDLPLTITDLVSDSGSFANWRGPYLVGAFDPSDYFRDAWGRNLIFTRHAFVDGKSVVGRLASLGPDGLAGTADDLNENSDPELQIIGSEVWPTNTVQGNLDYLFTAATTATPVLSARLYVKYNVASGPTTIGSAGCLNLAVGEVAAGEALRVRRAFAMTDAWLPVGQVTVGSLLYNSGDCSGSAVAQANETVVYVSDGLPVVAVNLPTFNYSVP